MPKPKIDPKKAASAAKDKLKNNAITKAAGDIFNKIQKKTGIDKKKVDAWQNKWIKLPEKRTKYEHLKDAPAVMGEELFAMANDIVDFAQGEHTGQSHVFGKIKENVSGFVKNPAGYVKEKGELAKKKAMEAKALAEKKAGEIKKSGKK